MQNNASLTSSQQLRTSLKNLKKTFFFCVAFSSFCTSLYAADLIIAPAVGTRSVGETFSVDVYVSDNKDAINAISTDIVFTKDTLELTSIRKTGSIISLWVEEPVFSNETGRASFQGAMLNPGFAGSQGKIVSLTFRVKREGGASISFVKSSILSNDGDATNVLGQTKEAVFSISGSSLVDRGTENTNLPVIISMTHPDSNKWYQKRDATFEWVVPSNVVALRTLYDSSSSSVPTKVYDTIITSKEVSLDEDGAMYMHLQYKTDEGWGSVAHYPFLVDTTPPTGVSATLVDGVVTRNPRPLITVTATDTTSGISSVGFIVGTDQEVLLPYDPSNTYTLPKKQEGKYSLVVSVYDKAGNKASTNLEYTVDPIEIPLLTDYTKTLEKGSPVMLSGTSYPQAIVEVVLVSEEGKVYTQTTTADASGVFSLIWNSILPSGVYEMKARAIDSKGAVSAYTNTKVVHIQSLPLLRFGLFIMNWLSVVLITIFSCFLIVATLWYSFLQFNRFKRRVKRTMRDAEVTLRSNVLALRRDTEEFHTLLVKAEKKRELTKEETSILKKFKKRLDITEKEIEKKLEQIG